MDMTDKIGELIDGFHISRYYKGYRYTITAVSIAIKKGTDFKMDESSIFMAVAADYGVKWENVYRDIQTFCKAAWESNPDWMQKISLEELYDRPSVKTFIDDLARQLMCGETRK